MRNNRALRLSYFRRAWVSSVALAALSACGVGPVASDSAAPDEVPLSVVGEAKNDACDSEDSATMLGGAMVE